MNCGADPLVCAGRPRPAARTTISAPCRGKQADEGVGRRPGGLPHKTPNRYDYFVMHTDSLDCLDLLESTPAILRDLMSELSEEDARWKPAPDRFSVAEVLAHLSHSEGHCYRARLDRFLSEELPEVEPDHASLHYDLYRQADPQDSFDHFEEQRETNVEFMRTLPRSAGARRARHREAGEITLSEMLHEWALHDLGHIRQVAELVRARRYLPGAGPLGRYYKLNP